jgi:uncharacterized protein
MDLTTTGWLLALAAVFISGLSKTAFPGISVLGIVLLVLAFPGQERATPGLLLPLLLIGDLFAVGFYKKHTDWKTLRRLFPPVGVGLIAGWQLLQTFENDNQLYKLVLGVMLLSLICLDFLRKRFGDDHIPKSYYFALVMGFMAGIATTLANAAGPIMAVYLLAIGSSKEKFMGCAAWFFFIVNMLKVPIYIQQDILTWESLRMDLYIVPGMILGAICGRPLLKIVSQRVFNTVIMALAALGAIFMIYRSLG